MVSLVLFGGLILETHVGKFFHCLAPNSVIYMHLLSGLFCFNLSEKQLHSEPFVGIKFEILQVLYILVEQGPGIF